MVQKFKIVSLSWNLVPILIRICRIQWMDLLFFFQTRNTVFGQIWPKIQNYQFKLKSSFYFQDIQILVYLSSPLSSPVSHCFRGWSKIHLKAYNIINCLNKNLITHFDILRMMFFLSYSFSLMDKIMKNKRGRKLGIICCPGYKTYSEKFLYYWCITWPSLIMQNKMVFGLFQKLQTLFTNITTSFTKIVQVTLAKMFFSLLYLYHLLHHGHSR